MQGIKLHIGNTTTSFELVVVAQMDHCLAEFTLCAVDVNGSGTEQCFLRGYPVFS